LGRFKLGTTVVANIKSWSGGGLSKQMLDMAALEDAYDKWTPGKTMTEPITLTGFYDPGDSTGQEVLRSYCLSGTALNDPRLYYSSTVYFKLYDGSSAPGDCKCYVENVSNTSADRDASGMCPISFTLRVSDGYFVKSA